MKKEYFAYISKIDNLYNEIQKSLEFIQYHKYIKNNSTIFIKPNFTFPYYKEGITTNPLVLQHLLGLLKDKVDRVIIGEDRKSTRLNSSH